MEYELKKSSNNYPSIRSKIGELIQRYNYFRIKKKRKSVNILNWEESINVILHEKVSLCRFGDGELGMVYEFLGYSKAFSTFQKYESNLGQRLYEILVSPPPKNTYIGLPRCMFGGGVSDLNFGARYFWERFSSKWTEKTINLLPLQENIKYADTNLTRFYNDFKDKSSSVIKVNLIKKIWKDRNVLIVEGCKTRFGVGNDLLKGANSIKRILVPATNAWEKYNIILESIFTHYKPNDLVLIAAGMTATVLAYDLSRNKIQAIDIGHLDIEYEWLNSKASSRIKITGKFTNESPHRDEVADVTDREYVNSIICKIN